MRAKVITGAGLRRGNRPSIVCEKTCYRGFAQRESGASEVAHNRFSLDVAFEVMQFRPGAILL